MGLCRRANYRATDPGAKAEGAHEGHKLTPGGAATNGARKALLLAVIHQSECLAVIVRHRGLP